MSDNTISDLIDSASDVEWGDREPVTTYVACCYGDDGCQPGDVTVSVCPVTATLECPDCEGSGDCEAKRQAMHGHPSYETLEDEGFFACPRCDGEGRVTFDLWGVEESDSANSNQISIHATREEAEKAAENYAEESNETLDLDELIEQILATGWFDESVDADDVRDLCEEATGHSQGYVLFRPVITRPIGCGWTTNGYLQGGRWMSLDATHERIEFAAADLLSAVQNYERDRDEIEGDQDDE